MDEAPLDTEPATSGHQPVINQTMTSTNNAPQSDHTHTPMDSTTSASTASTTPSPAYNVPQHGATQATASHQQSPIVRCPLDILLHILDNSEFQECRALSLTCRDMRAAISLEPGVRWTENDLIEHFQAAESWPGNIHWRACFNKSHMHLLHKSGFADGMRHGGYGGYGKKKGEKCSKRICWDCTAALGSDGPYHHLAVIHKNKEKFHLCHQCKRWGADDNYCQKVEIRDANSKVTKRFTVCRPPDEETPDVRSSLERLPAQVQQRIVAILSYQDLIMLSQCNRHFRRTVDPQSAPLHDKFRRMQEQWDIYQERYGETHPLFMETGVHFEGYIKADLECSSCPSYVGLCSFPYRDLAHRLAKPIIRTSHGPEYLPAAKIKPLICLGCRLERGHTLPCYGCFRWRPHMSFSWYQLCLLFDQPTRFWQAMCLRCANETFGGGTAKELDLAEWMTRDFCSHCKLLKYREEGCQGCIEKFGGSFIKEGSTMVYLDKAGKEWRRDTLTPYGPRRG